MEKAPGSAKGLEHMDGLGFRHREKFGPIYVEMYLLRHDVRFRHYQKHLTLLHDWLLLPYSFWPVDVAGIAAHTCKELQAGRPLSQRLRFTLDLLHRFPPQLAQELVAANEKNVSLGEYKQFVRSNAKFEAHEKRILSNPLLQRQWEKIKAMFPVHLYVDTRRGPGIVRRRMICERNFKTEWDYICDTDYAEFQTIFDSFCWFWGLYGMEGDKALILKLTVNVTPHGTLIMIPFYMSPDFRRDINTKAITKLHKLMGADRVGEKLYAMQTERDDEACRAARACQVWLQQGKQGTGLNRYDYIRKEAGLSRALVDRQVLRLVKDGEKLLSEPLEQLKGLTEPFDLIPHDEKSESERLESAKRIANVKTVIADLTPQEKREVMKLLAVGWKA
ncbi:MAG: hypothetical protein JWM68_3917 [Verrucomicrobiales bacterium]|nr:hypothetical protein [Verrucomicrobiales bacterium]